MRPSMLVCSFALAFALPACESAFGPVVRDIHSLGGGKIAVESCYMRAEAMSGRTRAGYINCSEHVVDVNVPSPPTPPPSETESDRRTMH